MTEDEAKQKVCPIANLRGGYDGNWDKGMCIGSACMMWRFTGSDTSQSPSVAHYHCGLAGDPCQVPGRFR